MKPLRTLFLVSILTVVSLYTHAQIITTYAGTGTPGYNGDNIPCTTSTLDTPGSVATDKFHNVYIADTYNYRIRKINSSGIITTIAGTGIAGYSGDNGPATIAEINSVTGIVADDAGDVYFSDYINHCVRKINSAGIITTIAGTGTAGYSGDNGPATAAELAGPNGISADMQGNVYIADEDYGRIRKINAAGIITTIAGGGSVLGDNGPATAAMLNAPYGLTIDSLGNLYIADLLDERVRKVNTSGIITTIAGNGSFGYNGDVIPATAAKLYGPTSVITDNRGNVYIAEDVNSRIRKINAEGIISTIAGNGMFGFGGDNGPAINAIFYNPFGIALDDSVMYIADASNNRIRRIGNVLSVAGVNTPAVGISITPNPNTGRFSVTVSSGTVQQVQIMISNVLGEKTTEYTTTTNRPLDINITVSPGMYFLSAVTATNKITRSIVVQ